MKVFQRHAGKAAWAWRSVKCQVLHSPKQEEDLLSLLKEAGHADFRDARGPMGFTQRQAAGKFTGEEAAGFLNRLTRRSRAPRAAVATTAAELSV